MAKALLLRKQIIWSLLLYSSTTQKSYLWSGYDTHSLWVLFFSQCFSFSMFLDNGADAAPSECQIWSTFVITPRIMLTEETVAHIQIYDCWRIRLICCFFLFYTTMQIQLHCIEAQFLSDLGLCWLKNCTHADPTLLGEN